MIKGDKVVLRALELQDADVLHRWVNDPDVVHHMGMRFPKSLHEEQRWLERDQDPTRELHLGIETPEGRLIGSCGLHRIDLINREAALGIMLGEKYCWGQGYGTDAMLTLCGFAFSEMNLHRICLYVFDFNPRAIACYLKVGFVEEGRLRESTYKHGRYVDVLVMGLLEEEFRTKWPQRWPQPTS